MAATPIHVRLPARGPAELEAALSEQITRVAAFISATDGDVSGRAIGERVAVALAASDGRGGVVVTGVIAWRYEAEALPVGREPGIGVLIDDVVEGAELFARAVSRAGSGGRVRLPGHRINTRLDLVRPGETVIVVCRPAVETPAEPAGPGAEERTVILDTGSIASQPARDDQSSESGDDAPDAPVASREDASPTVPPTPEETDPLRAPTGAQLRPELEELTAALDDELDDSLDGDVEDDGPLDRAAIVARALGAASHHGDGPTLDGDPRERAAQAEPVPRALPVPRRAIDADLSALAGPQNAGTWAADESRQPFEDHQTLRPPSLEAAEGVASFPDAFNDGSTSTGRPFEAQSTDVDLLASVSAVDVVALDLASSSGSLMQPVTAAGEIDLPSADDAVLLDLDQWPAASGDDLASLATELFSTRALPLVEGWPAWSDLLDARTMGVAFTIGRRGATGLEYFAWPMRGSKRYSGQGDPADPRRSQRTSVALADALSFDDAPVDGGDEDDVFSAPPPPPSLPAAHAGADPFAPQGTDPRLNVEGVVAKNVRKSHSDVVDDPVLFGDGDPDATRDEMMLPALQRSAMVDPVSGTVSGEGETSSSSSSEPE